MDGAHSSQKLSQWRLEIDPPRRAASGSLVLLKLRTRAVRRMLGVERAYSVKQKSYIEGLSTARLHGI